jgi:hypothetical protein
MVSSRGDRARPAAPAAATASAAKPDADDARPDAVGKSLRVATAARVVVPARWRTRSSHSLVRARSLADAGSPSRSISSAARVGSKRTVVIVDSAPSVSDRLPAAGRFRAGSRFPQYLTRAMLAWARAVTGVPSMAAQHSGCAPSPPRRHSGSRQLGVSVRQVPSTQAAVVWAASQMRITSGSRAHRSA